MLIPKTHILRALVNAELPERHVTALSEFLDNSLGEGAGNAREVTIYYDEKKIGIVDNGTGIKDLNVMFTLGDSASRLNDKDIGQYGYGSKVGALYLAWESHVATFCEGQYHEYQVDWKKVMETGKWPEEYKGEGKKSPRYGNLTGYTHGTEIWLYNRHKGRIWQGPTLAEHLAHIFRPALLKGRKIRLIYNGRGRRQDWDLSDYLGKFRLIREMRVKGAVNGKSFTIHAGRSKLLSGRLNAIHIAFGHRFIESARNLIHRYVPAELYAEVVLGKEWKSSISANKSGLSDDHDALLVEVEKLIAPLIDELEAEAENIEIKGFTFELERETEELIEGINKVKHGDHSPGQIEEVRVGEGRGGENPDQPGDIKEQEVEIATPNGKFGADHFKKEKKRFGVKINREPMEDRVTKVSFNDVEGIKVTFNKNLKIVNFAFKEKNRSRLFSDLFHALLDDCELTETHRRMFPEYQKLMDSGKSHHEIKQIILMDMYELHSKKMEGYHA